MLCSKIHLTKNIMLVGLAILLCHSNRNVFCVVWFLEKINDFVNMFSLMFYSNDFFTRCLISRNLFFRVQRNLLRTQRKLITRVYFLLYSLRYWKLLKIIQGRPKINPKFTFGVYSGSVLFIVKFASSGFTLGPRMVYFGFNWDLL